MGTEGEIRLRACPAVLREHSILLVPHFGIGDTPVEWNIPRGKVEFGERVEGELKGLRYHPRATVEKAPGLGSIEMRWGDLYPIANL